MTPHSHQIYKHFTTAKARLTIEEGSRNVFEFRATNGIAWWSTFLNKLLGLKYAFNPSKLMGINKKTWLLLRLRHTQIIMSRLIGLLTNLAALDSDAQTTYNHHHPSILTFKREETLSREVVSMR